MTVTGQQYVNKVAELLRGAHYDQCSSRCYPDRPPHCTDCSGVTSRAEQLLGLIPEGDCEGSFEQARRAHAAGPGIPFAEALWKPGCWGFIGMNEGQGGVPGRDPGHVFTFVGDGVHSAEARGHHSGVGIYDAHAHESTVDWCGMPPGVTRAGQPGTPAPTPQAPAPYYANEEALDVIILPTTAQTPHGEVATARAEPRLDVVMLEGGARLVGDVAVAGTNNATHTWAPPKAASVPGWDLVGIADLRFNKEHPEAALLALYKFPNGDTGTYKAQIA